MSDLRDRIKSKCNRRYKTVKIQGEELTIQTLSVTEAEDYFQNPQAHRLIMWAVVDPETKNRVFLEEDEYDLMNLEAGLALPLRLEIQRFNGFVSFEDEEGN